MLHQKQLVRRVHHALSAIVLRVRLTPQALRSRATAMPAAPLLALFAALCIVFVAIAIQIANLLLLRPIGSLLFARSGMTARPKAKSPVRAPPGHASFLFAEQPSFTSVSSINYASLPLQRPEADLLLSHLRASDTYLEFGASGATLTFPSRVASAYAIEHRPRVCAVLASELSAHADALGGMRAFCAPADTAALGGFHMHKAFVEVPRNNLSDVRFDAVLLNGPARIACAIRVLPQLKPDARVFFPAFFARPAHHSNVWKFYDEIARVRARSDAAGGLLVLRPKAQFVGVGDPVSEEVVHSMYDASHPETPSVDSEMDFRWVQRPLYGGFNYIAMSGRMSRESARMRIVLDFVALPVVVAMWAALQRLFLRFFLPLIAAAGHGTVGEGLRDNRSGAQKRDKMDGRASDPHSVQAAVVHSVSDSAVDAILPKAD